MQESHGCVRVKTTWYPYRNPGLMQCFEGDASCDGVNPCPDSTIEAMVREGTAGHGAKNVGLARSMDIARASGADGAIVVYRAAKVYNSGHYWEGEALEGASSGTQSYASDIANRLTGHTW
jgi:tetrahydromethanopterin S-methyltransferase subunit D